MDASAPAELAVSNVGLVRLTAVSAAARALSPHEEALLRLSCDSTADVGAEERLLLLDRKWVEPVPPGTTPEDLRRRYLRNPLEHVTRVNFEVTNRCNFACRHCRNAEARPATEHDMSGLVEAGRLFVSLGIRRFDFISGEVTRYGSARAAR